MRTFFWWLGYLFLVSIVANAWVALSGASASDDAFQRGVAAGEGFMNRFGVIILALGYVSQVLASQKEWTPPPSTLVKVLVVLGMLGNLGQCARRSLNKKTMRESFVTACAAKGSRPVCECVIDHLEQGRTSAQFEALMVDLGRGPEMSPASQQTAADAVAACRPATGGPPTIEEQLNGTAPQRQQPLPAARPGMPGWRPSPPPAAPVEPGEVPTTAAKSMRWSVDSPNGSAHLEQTGEGDACTLRCTLAGKDRWQTGSCYGDSTDVHFVSNDCERFVVFYARPTGARVATTKFISVYDRAKLAWDVLGGGLVPSETARGARSHLVNGLGGNAGEGPHYASDGQSVEFTSIDSKPQQVPLLKR